MKTLTKKLWLTILAFTLTLCTAFGVILTMPLAKADDSAAEPPDFSTWFAEPLELDDVIAQRYIRYTPSNADNYDATEEQFHWVSTQNIGLFFSSLTGDGRYNAMYNEDVIKPVAVEDKSYVYYIDLYEYEYHGLDDNDEQLDISVSIREGDTVKDDSETDFSAFTILEEPPVSGLASKTLEVGDDLAGKWVYMPYGAMTDVVLSKTLSIDQGEDETLEVDFFLGFYGNPENEPNQAADGCPCSWEFSEIGIEVFTDGSKAYYKIPETFTLTHGNEFAINETEVFGAGDLVVKRIDAPEDGPQLILFYDAPVVDDETPDNPGEDVTPDNPTDEQPGESENNDVKTFFEEYGTLVICASVVVLVLIGGLIIIANTKKR